MLTLLFMQQTINISYIVYTNVKQEQDKIKSQMSNNNHPTGVTIWIETSTKMYTPFQIGFSLQYGPYAHFGYWTLVSDP